MAICRGTEKDLLADGNAFLENREIHNGAVSVFREISIRAVYFELSSIDRGSWILRKAETSGIFGKGTRCRDLFGDTVSTELPLEIIF